MSSKEADRINAAQQTLDSALHASLLQTSHHNAVHSPLRDLAAAQHAA
jgi:hypothetical protein